MFDGESRYRRSLEARRKSGLFRRLVDAERLPDGRIRVDGRVYTDFSSNDYLGLSRHPALIERAREWAARGTGAAASRLVTGNAAEFAMIEAKVAMLKRKPAALVIASGFQTNAAVLAALLDRRVLDAEPLVFADRLNHASMHFGCRAAAVAQIRYRHADADHLAELMDDHRNHARPKFILSETVFSMDGDVAPVAALADLAGAHGATLIVDDAHATGALGEAGRGFGDGADIVIGTFSKALGSFGGFVACSEIVRDYLINACSGLIYSTALPPPVLGAIDAALDLVAGLDAERAHVARLADRFRSSAQALGFDTGASTTQIVPLLVGEADAALDLSDALREAGFWITAIRPPTVPKGSARLRVAFSAAHEEADVDRLLDSLGACGSRPHSPVHPERASTARLMGARPDGQSTDV